MVVDGRGSSPLLPDGFMPKERAFGIHCKTGWVGPTVKLDRMERKNISSPAKNKASIPRSLLLNRLRYASSHF